MSITIQLDESNASRRVLYLWAVGSNGTSPATGEAGGRPLMSVRGLSMFTTANTLSALSAGAGHYSLVLAASEVSVDGPFTVLYTSATALSTSVNGQIVAYNPYTAYSVFTSADSVGLKAQTHSGATIAGVNSVLTVNGLATSVRSFIAADVWDEVLTGATHNIAASAGRRLRTLSSDVIRENTAQSGTTNTITLDTGASGTDNFYDPSTILITDGTGQGQARTILKYVGSTKVATVDRDWIVTPDATSQFAIRASTSETHIHEGTFASVSASTVQLNGKASSDTGVYLGQTLWVRSGLGQGQARVITGYDGATKIASFNSSWASSPDTNSGYVIWPTGFAIPANGVYSGVTVQVNGGTVGLTAGRYSDVTIGGVERVESNVTIASGSYSSLTIAGVERVNSSVTIANADYSAVTVRTSNVTIASGGIVAASFGAGAIDAVAIATDATEDIADGLLGRNIAGGSSGGRTVAQALAPLRNRVQIDGSIGTVYQVNDTSSLWTFSVTTVSANSGVLNQVDPGT